MPNDVSLTRTEQKFVQMNGSHGLFQMYNQPNSRGKYLDLVMSTDISNIHCNASLNDEQLDENSSNHNAVKFSISGTRASKKEPDTMTNRKRICLKASAHDMRYFRKTTFIIAVSPLHLWCHTNLGS